MCSWTASLNWFGSRTCDLLNYTRKCTLSRSNIHMWADTESAFSSKSPAFALPAAVSAFGVTARTFGTAGSVAGSSAFGASVGAKFKRDDSAPGGGEKFKQKQGPESRLGRQAGAGADLRLGIAGANGAVDEEGEGEGEGSSAKVPHLLSKTARASVRVGAGLGGQLSGIPALQSKRRAGAGDADSTCILTQAGESQSSACVLLSSD